VVVRGLNSIWKWKRGIFYTSRQGCPGMPHLPYNPSESESCTALIARTDPNEQESVLLLPELDEVWQKKRSVED
jgi:uncharacterized RmlC-like cupin family protein